MPLHPIALLAESNQPDLQPVFQILLLYEDFAGGRRANEVCQRLAVQFADDLDFEVLPWKINLLRLPEYRELIDADAGEADLVVVALHEHTGPSAEVDAWLNQWTARCAGRPMALVALIDADDDPTRGISAAIAHLHGTATQAGIDFFHAETHATASPTAAAGRIAHRAHASTSTLTALLAMASRPSYSRWGLNE